MGCSSHAPLGSPEYLKEVFERVERERLPLNGSFDLTYRCNYRCVHCYVGHMTSRPASTAAELRTDEVVSLLTEAADAGCLMLLLSGGEPLLRRDFLDIYVAARKLGLVTTVFTNASLVTAEHVDVFAEYPPHMVEVSVYGATAATYEKVTRTPGSHRRALAGIHRLLDGGVRVGIKTMILKDNLHEVPAIEAEASRLGVPFRLDPLVTPRMNGDPGPLEQRVDPRRAVEVEMAVEGRRTEVATFLSTHRVSEDRALDDSRYYLCGAGGVSFYLDPEGIMHPCLMSRRMTYNTRPSGFANAWTAMTTAVDQATWDASGDCVGCSDIMLCGYCPGLFELEQASPSRPPEYVCHLGRNRFEAVGAPRLGVPHVEAR